MTSNDWLIDVLEDIRHFADDNGLAMTAEAVKTVLNVLEVELPLVLDINQSLAEQRMDGRPSSRMN